MIQRHIQKAIDYAIQHFPCVILTGPRQVGKTTLLSHEYLDKGFSYVTLDNAADRLLATNDPKAFLELHPAPLIIDEVQKAVELFPELEYLINEKRRAEGNGANGMYILTGSSRKDLLERARESLAGRVAILEMSPLSQSEILNRPNIPFIPDAGIAFKRSANHPVMRHILKGSLPALYDDAGLQSPLFYSSYISTYMEKDVRDQIELRDEKAFHDFLTILASLTGQELIYENLAREIGVSANTIKNWIGILAKTGVIRLLQPYSEFSWTKRVVKRPKIYFFDTGVACHLLGIESVETLERSYLKGPLFETYVVNEIFKTYENEGEAPNLFYYRDSNQHEVDLVLVRSGTLHCIEIKCAKEPHNNDAASFRALRETKYAQGKGAIICNSSSLSAVSEQVLIIPVSAI